MKKYVFLSYALIWFAVSLAVIIGIVVTKDLFCLCGFIIPLFTKPAIWNNENKQIWGEDNKKEKEQ